jgi:type VI secretion system secreted protein VgrG
LGGDVNLYAYAANNPLGFIDPFGLDKERRCGSGSIRFNPAKGIAGVASTVNAGRLYTTGAVKLAAAAGLEVTGVGTPGSVSLAAWAFFNFRSGYAADQRGRYLLREAFAECSSDARLKNLLGFLPFGPQYDDPSEPSPGEFFKSKVRNTSLWEWLSEFGVLSP